MIKGENSFLDGTHVSDRNSDKWKIYQKFIQEENQNTAMNITQDQPFSGLMDIKIRHKSPAPTHHKYSTLNVKSKFKNHYPENFQTNLNTVNNSSAQEQPP